MIDLFSVITSGGFVLFTESFTSVDRPIVDALIKDSLAYGRGAKDGIVKGPYCLKWAFANDLGIIFVVVYQHLLNLSHVDDLLQSTKRSFIHLYGDHINMLKLKQASPETWLPRQDFQKAFYRILKHVEQKSQPAIPRVNKSLIKESHSVSSVGGTEESGSETTDGGKGSKSKSGKGMSREGSDPGIRKRNIKGKPKAKRIWDPDRAAISKEVTDSLDFSGKSDGLSAAKDTAKLLNNNNMGTLDSTGAYQAAEIGDGVSINDQDIPDAELEALGLGDDIFSENSEAPRGFFGFLKSQFTGSMQITAGDLQKPMNAMQEQLVTKNVARHVSINLTEHVSDKLRGRTVSSWKGVGKVIRESLAKSLEQILTPDSTTDLLNEIRNHTGVYAIVFVGVNGVGKSTNLSKVAFWLLQNGMRVLIAGCDTFRSGAVEQLKVHARNLGALVEKQHQQSNGRQSDACIELFEQGYGKDASRLAQQAIGYARQNDFNVVLIDTAGRMQNNEPLMRALGKLVKTNLPQKILFIGEALVGNEAVDQVEQFNRALIDSGSGREIDGMILTKFDTIDDKVGAAVSMTYITGKPIFFLGTGETYTDLKRMNVAAVVNSLLS